MADIRKKRLCRCGCRGWCTLDPLFRWVHWVIAALACGVFPARRHDEGPFGADEVDRLALAGTPMRMRAALLW
eukprot:13320150-Alexandrium_andersonii.AAC.1